MLHMYKYMSLLQESRLAVIELSILGVAVVQLICKNAQHKKEGEKNRVEMFFFFEDLENNMIEKGGQVILSTVLLERL